MPKPLILKIDVDEKGRPKVDLLNKALHKTEKQAKKSGQSIKLFTGSLKASRSILNGVTGAVFSLKGAFVALGLGYLTKSAVSTAAGFDAMRISLDTITKGKGTETFKKLNEWALRMPVNTERAIEAFTKMRAMGLKPTLDEMTILVDTTSAFGGSAEIMDSLAMALGKIQAKGKASARDILMFTERGVPAIEILQEELNDTSIGFENIANSSHSAGAMIQALFSGMEKRYGGLSKRIQVTYGGLMETIRSEFKDFIRIVFMEGGVLKGIEAVLKKITDKILELRKEGKLDEWAKKTANAIFDLAKISVPAINLILQAVQLVGNAFFGWVEIMDTVKIAITKLEEKLYSMSQKLISSNTLKWSVAVTSGALAPAVLKAWDKAQAGLDTPPVGEFGPEAPDRLLKVRQAQEDAKEHLKLTVEYNEKWENSINKVQDGLKNLPKWIDDFKDGLEKSNKELETTEENVKKTGKAFVDPNVVWRADFIESEIESTMNVLTKAEEEFLRTRIKKTEEFTKDWEKLNKSLKETFVDSISDMLASGTADFKSFFLTIKNMFVKTMAVTFTKKFFQPITDKLVDAMTDSIGGMMKGVQGGGKGGTGFLGGIGNWLGGYGKATGGVGPLQLLGFGSMLMGNIGKLFGGKRKATPAMNVQWEITGEGFTRVVDSWTGGLQKNQQVLEQTESVIKEMTNMYGTLADFSNTTINNVKVAINDINRLMLQTEKISYDFAQANSELLERYFGGEAVPSTITDQIEAVKKEIADVTAAGPDAFGGWTGRSVSGISFHTGIFPYIQTLNTLNDELTSLYDQFNDNIESLFDQFMSFADEFGSIIGSAFENALETREFSSFKNGLRQGIFESFRNALFKEFTTTALHDVMMSVWDVYGLTGWGDVAKAALSGETGTATSMIEDMTNALDQIEPVFQTLMEALGLMENSLNLNTEAIVTNNDLLTKQEQIEDFISELTTGTLAPVQSLEGIMGRYEELLAGDNLSELFNFVTGTALPFLQTYGGNYQEAFAGILEDLRNLSGLFSAGISPTAIGDAVAGALLPAISGGTQTIHVTVEVDGKAIGEVVLDQLQSDPSLVTAIQNV